MLSKAPLFINRAPCGSTASRRRARLVVEAVSGKFLGTLLHERVWAPLGMSDTSFIIPEGK
jgi:hypothetical protein